MKLYPYNNQELAVGKVIRYKLLPSERPTGPDKEWRGKIIHCYRASPHTFVQVVKVVSLEEGYEGVTDVVLLRQIVLIEKDTEGHENLQV